MANLKRYFEENRAYFITTVTKSRKPIFMDKKMCRILLITLEYYKTILDYQVHSYCLMPDHLHLLVTPSRDYNLSFVMKMVKGSFARKVNKLQGSSGPVWQKRYYDQVVRDENQLFSQINYIHENPIVAGLAATAEEYPYSSFSQYHGHSNPLGQILQVHMPGEPL